MSSQLAQSQLAHSPAGSSPPSPASGARHGRELLQRLREHPPEIWYGGERVAEPLEHPAFRNGMQTLARLYDLQWEHADVMLFDAPGGRKANRSFMIPRTQEEL